MRYKEEIDGLEGKSSDMIPGGIINFSIDYSLKCSSIGAILRLLGLYLLRLIPHIVVSIIYSVLSIILGMMNWIVILITGDTEEDFLEIQENTLRYIISLGACAMDIIEEAPKFTGKKNIDYSLQFDIIYPARFSRFLSLLRLSVVGILIVALPHLILLTILSLGSILIYLSGLISIIFIKRWPNVLFDFMVRYLRYTVSVVSFLIGLADRYPSFRVE